MKNHDQVHSMEELNTVPFTEFNMATAEWNGARMATNGMLGSIILPSYFEIPLGDLSHLLREIKDGSVSVRGFIGVSPYGEYNGMQNTSEMKLFFTGVDADGHPILNHSENNSKIYDFVTPCPPTCQGGGGTSK